MVRILKIHVALLVLISSDYNLDSSKWQLRSCKNCTFAVLFLTFCVSNLFCFTLLLWKSAIFMDTVFLRKSFFRLRCSKLVIHVIGEMLVCMLSTLLRWCHETFMFCYFGLLYLRFSLLYKKSYFAWLRQGLLSRSLKGVTHLLDWLYGLSSPMLSLCCLVISPSRSKRFKFSGPCLLKKGTHLGHWPTFLSLTVREFSHFRSS